MYYLYFKPQKNNPHSSSQTRRRSFSIEEFKFYKTESRRKLDFFFLNSKIQTCKYANNLDQTSEIRTADIFQKMQKFPSSEKGKKRKKKACWCTSTELF